MNGTDRPANGNRLQRLRDLPKFLRAPRAAGLWLVGVLIPVATVASFVVSYRGLFDWAIHHSWPWYLAPALPLIVDLLIIAGEIVLFVAAIDGGTPWHVRAWAWVVTVGFTAISIAGNVSHAVTNDVATRVGWGLPPAGIAIALGFGLGELKRQADKYREAEPESATEPVRVTEGRPPSEWLDDQILVLLARMSARSTAEALGVSKTRVETAKRRAALAAAEDPPAGAPDHGPPRAPAGALNGQGAHG